MKMIRLPHVLAVLAVLALAAVFCVPGGSTDEPGGEDISSGKYRLNIVAYAVPKVGYDVIIPAFRGTEGGGDTGFAQSYGGSGDQSRNVVRHVPADVVNFSVEPDITRLVKAGLVDKDWKGEVPNDPSSRSVPFGSVVSFVTRAGNPKGIENWDDLLSGDVEVISPNPASSGSAKWNLLAPYAYWFFQDVDSQKSTGRPISYVKAHEVAISKLSQLVDKTFKVRPKSGREATSTFEQGQGDVLLSYENEAIFLARSGASVEYFNPPQTFLIENPVAVVNTSQHIEQARAFRDYLFTPQAQYLWAQQGFRPATDLFASGNTISTLDPEQAADFRPYERAWSIDDLSDAFEQLAQDSPDMANKYQLMTDGNPKTGWSIVDALLFNQAQPGSGSANGAITEIYKKV